MVLFSICEVNIDNPLKMRYTLCSVKFIVCCPIFGGIAMMQRITGTVAIHVRLYRDEVTDNGLSHRTAGGIARRTFTVERHANDTHRSVLYFDAEGVNPTTLAEQVTWEVTRAAWQVLISTFSGVNKKLDADWISNNVSLDISLSLESVYGFLRDSEYITDLAAPEDILTR